MATINEERPGYWRILFVSPDGKRKTIRLGKSTKKYAQSVHIRVENLLSARIQGVQPTRDDATWLAQCGDTLRQKLVHAGLIDQYERLDVPTIENFVKNYIGKRKDVKASTMLTYLNAQRNLSEFFSGRRIEQVTSQDARDFRVWLISDQNLCENTARKRCSICKQFFAAAVRSKLIDTNPFDGIPCAVRENSSRSEFISREDSLKVMAACPDVQWRMIFALCRWGGLRCPSEVLRLKWEDINWDEKKVTIHSSKTEHLADEGVRILPLFPELESVLLEGFGQAEPGITWVITKYRDDMANLRTQFIRILLQAGLEPWAKPFQNLRSTRETELFKLTNGNVKAVCKWIGNSPQVAMKHYAQVTQEDYDEVVMKAPDACDDADMLRVPRTKCAAQKAAQQTAARACTERKMDLEVLSEDEVLPLVLAGVSKNLHEDSSECENELMGLIGLEPMTSRV